MAVGDVVAHVDATVGSYISFQPAVSVGVMITTTLSHVSMRNSVPLTTQGQNQITVTGVGQMKLFIDNTSYLAYYSSGSASSYSGLQIK